MFRTFSLLTPWVLALIVAPALAQTLPPIEPETLRQKPITTANGPAGDLLRQWWKEGTAAGNVGDYYDNRDGDHSPLNRALFPQLSAVQYSPADVKLRKHWAAAVAVHPAVVYGNSSTSAPPTQGGSNPRSYYCSARGLHFLARQYAKNNLYIYPEHRDHDPGHNGRGDGFGDLYPTNTPYLLISQGSSGSDQPFMRAVPLTLAAFRPEVKRKLTEAGTLMPTVQMILRSTNKQLKGADEYLTGKAHPTVFEGSWIDEVAMVKLAHSLKSETLPPVAQIKVVEEDPAVPGVDYFEAGATEQLANTSAVIARIHRSKARKRRIVVSAEPSFDLNKAPLKITWVILRGDPARIQIKPRNPAGTVAEITVAYHERRPVAPGAALESNRVDVGVFVHNGTHYSAPAFITFFALDNEARTYDAMGRIREIGYGMGETDLRVTDWQRVLDVLAKSPAVGKLFGMTDARREALAKVAEAYMDRATQARLAEETVKAADDRAKKAGPEEKTQARKEADAARKRAADRKQAMTALLDAPLPALGSAPRVFFVDACRALARDPSFLKNHHAALAALKANTAPEKLPHGPLLKGLANLALADPASAPTAYSRAQIEHAHLGLLVDYAFPGMAQVVYQPNYVDQRLTAPKSWRDVYAYDAAGACIGWRRYHRESSPEDFNHDGLLVIERDKLGRCLKARTVAYTRAPSKAFPNPNPLRMELGDTFVTYDFAGPDDRRGHRAGSTPIHAAP